MQLVDYGIIVLALGAIAVGVLGVVRKTMILDEDGPLTGEPAVWIGYFLLSWERSSYAPIYLNFLV